MLNDIPIDRNCAVASKCMEISNGVDVLIKLAEYTADEWLEMYRYKPFVRKTPEVFQRYKEMNPDQQKKFNADNKDWIDEDEEMRKYAHHKAKVHLENDGNQQYLEDTVRQLSKDTTRKGKVEAILAGYPNSKVEVAKVDWHDKG